MIGADYIEAINRKSAGLDKANQAIGRAVFDEHRKITKRVFQDGLNARYSTKPTLVGSNVLGNTNRFGNSTYSFVTQAGARKYFRNTKDQKFVSVLTPKGRRSLLVVEGGYAEIRRADGRQANKVDLNRSGRMFKDFASGLDQSGPFAWTAGFRKEENVKKYQGAQKRYGEKILQPDPKAVARIGEAITVEITKVLTI